MNQLDEYLHTYFPGLNLEPSLYHQWPIGLHFELGGEFSRFMDDSDGLNREVFDYVYVQAESIFKDLFAVEDDVLLATNMYKYKAHHGNHRMKVYHRNLKNKELKYRIQQAKLPYVFDEEDCADEYYTSRYVLKCQTKDIHMNRLIKAVCNEDFPLKPRFGGDYAHYPDVFFVNTTKDIIFFVYDDRGCEVIASDLETIRPLYEKYGDWIPEYDLEEINERFIQRSRI